MTTLSARPSAPGTNPGSTLGSTASPIRYPDTSSQKAMTVRGWWLVVLNLLMPGSAQVLAGSRKLGRFGLYFTFGLWITAILGFVVYNIWPQVIFSIVTLPIPLLLVQIVLVAYAALWVVLTLDTLRLVRLVRAGPKARWAIAAFTVIMLTITSGGAAWGAFLAGVQRDLVNSIFSVQAAAEPPVDGRYNILLLGGDAGPDREGMRPDSMTVVSIEADTGRATMIGIPRDLQQVPIVEGSPLIGSDYAPDGVYDCGSDCQISFLYPRVEAYDTDLYPNAEAEGSEPGIEATTDAIEGALGITIQYYVLIDMQGFSDLIDALGGVDIDVTEELPMGGDENLNEVEGWIYPGMQHMDGYTALWYARSRHTTSDYDRMERQRQLQTAILQQFDPVNVLTKFQGIAAAGAQVVKTDIPQSTLAYFVDLALKTKDLPIENVELTPPLIDPEDPDWDLVHQTVADALVLSTATDTPTQ
ncbi:LCP family protein [Herbiconiux moechotypicola]|uniref:Cell envelope-related transcriptional attenuator domain-containing protein n=1 Tax=Herbiconiux moechotypicola TaxID=637393 RepID=A0ABP5QQS1_9MICO|nr:LCP family protein [Herbiconiux moechotypicola]MCS5730984.1 LCP family protein [Herbiconiux moechotypicola]